jgi:hypothetical protein
MAVKSSFLDFLKSLTDKKKLVSVHGTCSHVTGTKFHTQVQKCTCTWEKLNSQVQNFVPSYKTAYVHTWEKTAYPETKFHTQVQN